MKTLLRIAAATLILVGLLVPPAPLLPSHRLSNAVQSVLGLSWEAAYFVSAILLQTAFYLTLGLLASFVVNRAATVRGRLLQITLLPLGLVGFGLVIRSLRAEHLHLPVLTNIAVPVVACLVGVTLGLIFLYRRWKLALMFAAVGIAGALWGLIGGTSVRLRSSTEERLRLIVKAGPTLPAGEARFGRLLQIAFAPLGANTSTGSAIEQNRAAILALGIAVGHPGVARLVGLDDEIELVQQAAAVGQGVTLNGREDWPRHYAFSAALAVLKHSLVSDAGGLMKEQMDALARGTGFSFGDLAADRAGVRFAVAATHSEAAARAMQARLQKGYSAGAFFPAVVHFPENLTVEEFQRDYDAVGSQRYRFQEAEIEQELNACEALSVP